MSKSSVSVVVRGHRIVTILFAVIIFALPACSTSPRPTPEHPMDGDVWLRGVPHYDLNFDCQLASPPGSGSHEEQEELKDILSWQDKRTPEETARATSEAKVSLESFFGPPNGTLSDTDLVVLRPLFDKVRWSADIAAHAAKLRWKRIRPFVYDKRVHPPFEVASTSLSYPSGHSTIAWTFAPVLKSLFPKQAQAFQKRAEQIALDRVIAGVHHPSDVRAGKECGGQVFDALNKNSEFLSDLKSAEKALVRRR